MRLEVVNSGGVGSVSGGGRMNVPRMSNSRPIPYGGRFQRNSNQQPRKPRATQPEAKADDLDAEMDAYMAMGKKSTKTNEETEKIDDKTEEEQPTIDAEGDDNDLLDAEI